jgi:FKBP-type peptidyl-prolyl cis-trans isomerase
MKKTFLILAAVSFVLVSAVAKQKKTEKTLPTPPVVVFANGVDSMSYALGMNVGADFGRNIKGIPGGKTNLDLLIKGFSSALKGDSTLMKAELATEYFKNFITKAQAADLQIKKADGEKFLAENKAKSGVKTTESGLQYEVLVPADGTKPSVTDTVKVHYTGTFIDGTKFDSSLDRGTPATFALNQVIKGWTEGVQLMSVGSKYKFVVPYALAYGEEGRPNGGIPGFSTLVFEVELLAINAFKEAKPVVLAKPVSAPKAVKASSAKKK